MKRVAVFVDGSNCYYTHRKLGWNMDAEKLLEFCEDFGIITEATYYGALTADISQRNFYNRLAYIGYSLITKPLKSIYDPATGNHFQKANLDVEIVLDMFNTIDNYDVAVLVSGDGDFERALQYLKSRGKEVKVISTRGSVAIELVYATGINYIDLTTIRDRIERTYNCEIPENYGGEKYNEKIPV